MISYKMFNIKKKLTKTNILSRKVSGRSNIRILETITMDPLQFCTEEMWEKIMNELDYFQDKINLMRTNSTLETMFAKDKETILFPEVISLVYKWISHAIENNLLTGREAISARRSIFNCRGVSVSCCRKINDQIDLDLKANRLKLFGRKLRLKFESSQEISQYIDTVLVSDGKPDRTPLLTRILDIRADYKENLQEHEDNPKMEQILQLLNIMGHQLKKFLLNISVPNYYLFATFLQAVLRLTPNVYKLCVAVDSSVYQHVDNRFWGKPLMLPSNPSLRALYIHSYPSLHRFISLQDFNFNHLEFLQLSYSLLVNCDNLSFNELKQLCVVVSSYQLEQIEVLNWWLVRHFRAPKLQLFEIRTDHMIQANDNQRWTQFRKFKEKAINTLFDRIADLYPKCQVRLSMSSAMYRIGFEII